MGKLLKGNKTKFISLSLSALTVVFVILFSLYNIFATAQNNMEDRFLQGKGQVLTDIVILAIDTESINEVGRWPWPRGILGDLTEEIARGNPAVIGFDMLFTGYSSEMDQDERFSQVLGNLNNVVVGVKGTLHEGTRKKGQVTATELEVPYGGIYGKVHMGHINNILDKDKVARTSLYSFMYDGEEILSFDLKVHELYTKHAGGEYVLPPIPKDDLNRWYVTFTGEPFTFEYHSAARLLRGEIPPEYFEGKIVLIGPFDYGMQDSFITPLNHTLQMHGVEIHANIIQNLITGDFKRRLGPLANAFLILVLSALAFFIYKKTGPFVSLGAGFALGILTIVISRYVFKRGIITGFFYYILAIGILYLVNIVVKYLDEFLERKRITGAFGKYVAPQVVEKIIKDGEAALNLGGTRREITALFVDIRGFTPMSEKVEPEEVVGILNEYLNLTAVSIFENEGTLDKFMGDATMAIFNAPVEIEDHAFKAVKTAWAMKEGSVALQRSLEDKYGHSVQFGIGINTGYAVVGNIGAKFRMDYTAIGDTVNTAARLESNAKYGQILISSSTYEMVKDRILSTCLGEISVKGKEKGIIVYQVDGIGGSR